VIGDNHTYAFRQPTQGGQRAFSRRSDGNLKACVAQYGFADGKLQRIVVDEKNLPQSLI
jgi:hypothetical protein